MGLDFRYNGFEKDGLSRPHFSYSGFDDFRKHMFQLAFNGDLNDMEGFGEYKYTAGVGLEWIRQGTKSWEAFNDDPICLLIRHSDCDDELSAEDCAKIAPRLKELANAIPDYYFHKDYAIILANFMEGAAKRNTALIFC